MLNNLGGYMNKLEYTKGDNPNDLTMRWGGTYFLNIKNNSVIKIEEFIKSSVYIRQIVPTKDGISFKSKKVPIDKIFNLPLYYGIDKNIVFNVKSYKFPILLSKNFIRSHSWGIGRNQINLITLPVNFSNSLNIDEIIFNYYRKLYNIYSYDEALNLLEETKLIGAALDNKLSLCYFARNSGKGCIGLFYWNNLIGEFKKDKIFIKENTYNMLKNILVKTGVEEIEVI